mgnify:CR=1 FL=1
MKIVEGLLLSYFYIVFVLFFSQNITKSQEVSRKVCEGAVAKVDK